MLKTDDETFDEIVKNLGKDKKSLDEDVEIVVKWMQQQPHLPEVLDKRSVQNFLILNKFSIEKTKQRIDAYFTVKTQLEDVYKEINPKLPHMKEMTDIMYFPVHPRLFNNNRVFFFKMRNENLGEKMEPCNVLRYLLNIHELRMKQDIVCGEIFVLDCDKVPLSYYFKLTPSIIIKAMIIVYEKVYSNRLKALYVVNIPSIGEKVIALAKKILKPKIFNRFYVSSDDSMLKNIFSDDFLPEDYGGKGSSLEKMQEMLNEEIQRHQELFDHLDQMKVDESLRPEELKNDDLLGFHGNFKRLDID